MTSTPGQTEQREQVRGQELVARVDAVLAVERAADQHQVVAHVRQAHFLRELVDLVVEGAVEHDQARGVAVLDVEAREVLVAGHRGQRQRIGQRPVDGQVGARVLEVHVRVVRGAGTVRVRVAVVLGRERVVDLDQPHVGLVLAAVEAEQDVDVVARLPLKLAACGGAVDFPDLLAVQAVGLEAFALLDRLDREASRERVRERAADGALGQDPLVVADVEREVAVELVTRLLADEVDRAGRRVAAEQRALRALQHLDALEVEHAEGQHRRRHQVHVVDVDAGRGVVVGGVVVEADAADGDVRDAVGHHVLDLHVWRQQREVGELRDARLGEGLAGVGGAGDADVAEALLALLGGDEDLLELRRRRLRECRGRHLQCGQDGGAQEGIACVHWSISGNGNPWIFLRPGIG